MFREPYTASGNPAIGSSLPHHSYSHGPQNLVDSNGKPEYDDDNEGSNFGEIGMFGDFCLMCGEMIDGEGFDGSAYCSEECEYHQRITSESDWCDLSLEGYQLPSYGCSTAVSSAKTSPLNSPKLQASGRLAILCSGPPACELLLPLDLGERLLGAKAVAERYLDKRPNSRGGEEEEEEEDKKESEEPFINSTITPHSSKTLVSTGSHLKSRPALALLTDLDYHHHHLPSRFGDSSHSQSSSLATSPQSLTLIGLPLLSSSSVGLNSVSSPRRRVSEPAFHQSSKSLAVSPSQRQLYHSSFSLTSLSSLSPSSRDRPHSGCSTFFF
ncbi:hypothetical protein MJO28_007412 [Puccinia striiformis f. sp. tritici]|uniref:Uncharacterized protein n=4 Tax=Puccinia striiformis TaxID=27350 RepID=A0A0L0VWW1_9BASI|nr:hypothetical protein Pst134EA_013523 [Puccinia striiformis f. sp. tritici]KAI9603901.1 hypothetical protein H4Q26_003510 [Puccinia striiformis f. sp. tritici PST-130]KNF03460.1 hypothetical protein PSTG_03400 [Puccinia striiformis f. sp. tritici PST-78]POW10080.1 hypothetical protein PSTT_06359 [Puccinia striiformis]KAH9454423.1 hypothetical protein Pst134EB_014509 [Puccinia striiformis f. sp. tritici]KAH9465640.1 hypothetical protein Pst134EA_013523 [Puccinia striiformis f. sp. tritici]